MFIENVFITRMHFRSFVVFYIVCLSAPGKLHLTDILYTYLFSQVSSFIKDLSKRLEREHACTPWLTWLPDHHKGGEVFKIGTALPPCWQIFCFFCVLLLFYVATFDFVAIWSANFWCDLAQNRQKMAITNWAFLGLGGYWWWWWWLITVVMMALMMRSIIWLGQGWNCLTCSFYPITESFRGPPSKNWKPSNFRSNQTVYYGNQPRMMG